MSTTYTQAIQAQANVMLKIAARLDERGYAVVAHNLNKAARNDAFGYGYLLGGLDKFLRDWGAAHCLYPIVVHIYPTEWTMNAGVTTRCDFDAVAQTGKVFDHPFTFTCKIPSRVRYRSLHAAFGLMASERKRWEARASGATAALDGIKSGDYIEYRGDTKDKLEILLRILEMPPHREILKSPTTRRFV